MKRNYTFNEVFALDYALKKLAVYEVAGGKMVIPSSMEETTQFELDCAKKFNYFKGLVQSGECTIAYLKNTVLSRNGAYPSVNEVIETPEEWLEEIEADEQRQIEETDAVNNIYNQVSDLMNNLGGNPIMEDSYLEDCDCNECQAMREEEKLFDDYKEETTTSTTTPKPKKKKTEKKDETGKAGKAGKSKKPPKKSKRPPKSDGDSDK
jgi:hypothetical protein